MAVAVGSFILKVYIISYTVERKEKLAGLSIRRKNNRLTLVQVQSGCCLLRRKVDGPLFKERGGINLVRV